MAEPPETNMSRLTAIIDAYVGQRNKILNREDSMGSWPSYAAQGGDDFEVYEKALKQATDYLTVSHKYMEFVSAVELFDPNPQRDRNRAKQFLYEQIHNAFVMVQRTIESGQKSSAPNAELAKQEAGRVDAEMKQLQYIVGSDFNLLRPAFGYVDQTEHLDDEIQQFDQAVFAFDAAIEHESRIPYEFSSGVDALIHQFVMGMNRSFGRLAFAMEHYSRCGAILFTDPEVRVRLDRLLIDCARRIEVLLGEITVFRQSLKDNEDERVRRLGQELDIELDRLLDKYRVRDKKLNKLLADLLPKPEA